MKYISCIDPAIDIVAMGDDYQRYVLEPDAAALRYLPGHTPATWEVKPLDTLTYLDSIESEPEGSARYIAAFRRGVVRVRNLRLIGPGAGSLAGSMEPGERVMHGDGTQSTMWTSQQMASIAPGYVIDVGRVICTLSFFGRETLQGLPAPLSLLRAAQDLIRSRHAAGPSAPPPTTSAPVSAPSEASTPTVPTKRDSDMSATAEAP